jgi:trigger factor
MVMEFYQKNPSALASLRGNVYEEKIINLIKSKAKPDKKDITKDEAEKILKEANVHNHPHDHSHEESHKKKKQTKTKPQLVKKTKSIASKTKKTQKVSKK